MDKIWLKSYPPHVPELIDPARLRTLKQLLEETCARHAERAALVYMGATLTYAQLDHLSRACGAWLQQAGYAKGDRLAIMLPNTPQYLIAMFGALRAGLIVVNTNPLYTAPELEHQLADSGATAIVVLENFAHVVAKVLAHTSIKTVLVTGAGDYLRFPKSAIVNHVVRHHRKQVPPWNIPSATSFKAAVSAGLKLPLAPVDLSSDDLAFLQYTGGTTGVAKGAMLSHGNVSVNVLQAEAWIGKTLPEQGTLITAIPLYHIFALSCNCMVFARLGWRNVLIINPRDLKSLIADMKRYPCNFLSGVNTLFNAMLHAPGFSEIDFSGLKISLGGGMAVQGAVAAKWKEATGSVLSQAWGLTETSPAACINPPRDPRGRRGRTARRALRRSGGALRGAQGPGAHGEGRHRLQPPVTRRLQGTEACVFQVGAAEVECREDFEEDAERGIGKDLIGLALTPRFPIESAMRGHSWTRERERGNGTVLGALEAVFRPLARLLVEHGVSSPEAESLLRAICVHQAADAQAVRGKKKPNASRIALVTGLDRKEVARILERPPRMNLALETRCQRANKVLAGWYTDRTFVANHRPLVLPIKAMQQERPSFWMLANRYAPDVYPGLILRELSRVGAVERLEDGRVRARRRRYRGRDFSDQHLSEIRSRVRDLLLATGLAPSRKSKERNKRQ
jgi:acyl-CoA synthetase (AMP-forming)/AMP-acid ligase II